MAAMLNGHGGGTACEDDWAAPACSVEQTLVSPSAARPREPGEGDEAVIVTTVAFDAEGGLLATGDRGGRVCVYERDRSSRTPRYDVLCEFQSHDPEFDYLKSLEVEEKINQLRFCRGLGRRSCRLLAANDKTVKLWRCEERRVDERLEGTNAEFLAEGGGGGGGGGGGYADASMLRVPRVVGGGHEVGATLCRTYANAHAYHINSVSVNSDGEHFASADDLRVNVWNLEVTERAFNVVDLKPPNMEDLTEVITAAAFHPIDCHALLYPADRVERSPVGPRFANGASRGRTQQSNAAKSQQRRCSRGRETRRRFVRYASSRGAIKLFDLRQSARCDAHAKLFDDAAAQPARGGDDAKSFFSEIVSSISDARFDPTGRFVVSRDFLSVKVWDLRVERHPVACRPVHDHLKPRLCDLYESDCIFDKFEVAAGPGAAALATGSYSDAAHVFDASGARLEVDVSDAGGLFDSAAPAPAAPPSRQPPRRLEPEDDDASSARRDDVDFGRRVLHVAAHPREETFAVAGLDRCVLFHMHR